jgi:hypothetical protein
MEGGQGDGQVNHAVNFSVPQGGCITMPNNPRKLSEIMKEMAQTLLRNPSVEPSSEAAHAALMFANFAWNESVGLDVGREGYRNSWKKFEDSNPSLWDEFKSRDIDAMIDGLVEYKKKHYPDDLRRILVCGMVESGNVHVEWLDPVAPGVDSKWEMRLFGLVRSGMGEEAIKFLRETRRLSRKEAVGIIAEATKKLGMK